MLRLPFLEWAFNSRSNAVDIVIELIIVPDSIKKSVKQTKKGKECPVMLY